MSSVNKAILIGNVGNDPEIRYLEKGVAVATFVLATTERGYTTQNGTQVPDRTEWHNIVLWRGLAEWAERYVRKSMKLYVEGSLHTRSWEKEGIRKQKTEIIAENVQILWKPDGSGHTDKTAQEDPYLQVPTMPQAPNVGADSCQSAHPESIAQPANNSAVDSFSADALF